jgi:hypothetical protein
MLTSGNWSAASSTNSSELLVYTRRQGLTDIARHVIDTHLNLCFMNQTASYDMASDMRRANCPPLL